MSKRIGLAAFGSMAVAFLVASPGLQAASQHAFPDTISLPNGFQPEGIVMGNGTTIFAGSIPTGAIYKADVSTGEGAILVPPQEGRAAIGLDFDARTNIIYVAGGPTGAGYAYDADTGDTIAVFQFTTESTTFINDQIVVQDAVYFTDSFRPFIYRVPLSSEGELSPDAAFTEIPLTGDFEFMAGANVFNANGIAATRDGKNLILVNSVVGTLYRVDPATGRATKIDLGDELVTNGDGILLLGNELFVVQNDDNQIAVVELNPQLDSGKVKRVITDDRFDVPTTLDAFHGSLYVVNARFTTPPTPETTYTIEKVQK